MKFISLDGKNLTVKQWSVEKNIDVFTIYSRIKKGWSNKDILSTEKWFIPNKKYKSKYSKRGGNETHRLIAESALGHALPKNAEVHHVDGNGRNNKNSNLVICPDKAYHKLLHVRHRALSESGNANYRKCKICGKWDDPSNLYIHGHTVKHKECHKEKMRKYYAAKRENR